jgi:hypothetical protein
LRAGVVFLCAKHNVRVGGIIRRAAIAVAGIATRPLCRANQLTIDIKPHGPTQGAHRGDVVPCAVVHAAAAADSGSVGAHRDAKNEPPISQ